MYFRVRGTDGKSYVVQNNAWNPGAAEGNQRVQFQGNSFTVAQQSNGGFGCMLLLGHDWANPEATRRSYELIAQQVFPHFQGQAESTLAAKKRALDTREAHAATQLAAVDHMTAKYEKELSEKG